MILNATKKKINKMPLTFAANLSTMFLNTIDFEKRYRIASNLGFKGVECHDVSEYDVKSLRQCKDLLNLEQVLINSYSGPFKFGCAIECPDVFKYYFDSTLQYAKALNSKNTLKADGTGETSSSGEEIHILAGQQTLSEKEMDHNYMSNLCYAAKACEHENIIAVIEPICEQIIPNYFLSSFEKAMHYIKTIGSSHLKLLLDIYHLQMMQGNLTNTLKSVFTETGHIQISQCPLRNEPCMEGEINYNYILALLKNLGYDGWIGLEYFPSGSIGDSLGWIEEYGFKM